MFPTVAIPVWMPMRIPTGGLFCNCLRWLSSRIAADIANAVRQACSALWPPSSAFRLRTIDREKNLFRQGDSTRGLFFLSNGSIHLQRVTEAGHQVLVVKATAGETFAEASLFHRSYHCSAVATKPSKVIECAKRAVITRYREDPDFALAMSERFAHQVQHTRARLELYSIRSADDRVFRAVADGMLRDSVKSLAHEIGLSPEVVYRSLASLTKSGRIKKVGYGQYEA